MCDTRTCCLKMEEELTRLRREIQDLKSSYVAHLSHAHGVFGSDATRTTYVGIREKINHGQEQDSDSTAPASTQGVGESSPAH